LNSLFLTLTFKNQEFQTIVKDQTQEEALIFGGHFLIFTFKFLLKTPVQGLSPLHLALDFLPFADILLFVTCPGLPVQHCFYRFD
jgi:hypothetical protein